MCIRDRLMRGDLLGGRDSPGIFFYHIFYGLNTYSTALGRIEESVLVTGDGSDPFPDRKEMCIRDRSPAI